MSRTGTDAATFAEDLRERAGDGSIGWVNQPIQASALLDIADMLEENAKLRELVRDMYTVMVTDAANCDVTYPEQFDNRMREMGIEVDA